MSPVKNLWCYIIAEELVRGGLFETVYYSQGQQSGAISTKYDWE